MHKIPERCFALEMRVWASTIRTGLWLFKMFGTEHLRCSRLHPCSNTDGCVFFCSQSHSPPGRHRCRGHRPYFLAALPPAFLGGSAPAPSASAWEESWLVGTPPKGNNHKQSDYNNHVTVQHSAASV